MSPKQQRMKSCSREQAKQRLNQAKVFLEAAKLTQEQSDHEIDYENVTASLAVLASIAATDAACGAALGEYSREPDHRQAINVLKRVAHGGKQAATDLDRVLQLKDQAQYGAFSVTGTQVKQTLRRATKLIQFAEEVNTH